MKKRTGVIAGVALLVAVGTVGIATPALAEAPVDGNITCSSAVKVVSNVEAGPNFSGTIHYLGNEAMGWTTAGVHSNVFSHSRGAWSVVTTGHVLSYGATCSPLR